MAGGGTKQQAIRRSAATAEAVASDGVASFNVESLDIQVIVREPNQDELMLELSKKRIFKKTIRQKVELMIQPAVKERAMLLDKSKRLSNKSVYRALEAAIPVVLPKIYSGPQFAQSVVDIQKALKSLIDSSSRTDRQVVPIFKPFDDAIKLAISFFQSDLQTKQSSCFVSLTQDQKNRKYGKNGYLPIDKANRTCLICNHPYVDEPNSNKGLEQKYANEVALYEERKLAAAAEAKKNNTTAPRIKTPKLQMPYRICHCAQMTCLSVGSTVGSSCPIKCKKNDGTSFGIDEHGNCACEICICQCKIAYTYGAAQVLATKQLLDNNSIQMQKEKDVQTSRMALAGLLADATKGAVLASQARTNPMSQAQLETVAGTATAQAIASGFFPPDHGAFFESLRTDMGKPTTRVQLPAPIQLGGKFTSVVDTRTVSKNKGGHRAKNNKLSAPVKGSGVATLPLHPYQDVYDLEDTGIDVYNGKFATDDDAVEQAMKNSVDSFEAEARAQPEVIVVYTPPPPKKSTRTIPEGTEAFCNRVEKRAFLESQQKVEILDDTPGEPESPNYEAASPYAASVFGKLSNRTNDPSLATYVQYYHEANPNACSQEVYYAASDHLRTLDGKPHKKRPKK